MIKRLVALLEYQGSAYSGWQVQPFLSPEKTIQGSVEKALSQIAGGEEIKITCAGRTDAGVHSLGQVIHFDTTKTRDNFAWLMGTNSYLPKDIRLQAIKEVRADFDARRDAKRRHYRYLILNKRTQSAIYQNLCHFVGLKLNEEKMQQAANYLIGEHDFSSFRSSECQAKSPFRFIEKIEIKRKDDWLIFDVIGNAFLHHMVRNIVGTLISVGLEKKAPFWVKEVLEAKDRKKAGITAPASGLYLNEVFYDPKDEIPRPIIKTLPI